MNNLVARNLAAWAMLLGFTVLLLAIGALFGAHFAATIFPPPAGCQ